MWGIPKQSCPNLTLSSWMNFSHFCFLASKKELSILFPKVTMKIKCNKACKAHYRGSGLQMCWISITYHNYSFSFLCAFILIISTYGENLSSFIATPTPLPRSLKRTRRSKGKNLTVFASQRDMKTRSLCLGKE
jgi:hypothetical protein